MIIAIIIIFVDGVDDGVQHSVKILFGGVVVADTSTLTILCDDKWVLMQEKASCYSPFPAKLSWAEAKDECGLHQAPLVSIHSQSEQKFIVGKREGERSMRIYCTSRMHIC